MKKKELVYDEETGSVVEKDSAGRSEEKEKNSGPVVKLNTALLQAFIDHWMPAVDGQEPDVKMRLIDLRTYFQCYTTDDARCIDLLPYYLEALAEQGYTLRTDIMGQPYLPVKRM